MRSCRLPDSTAEKKETSRDMRSRHAICMQIIGTRYVRFCFLDGLAWRLGRTRHWGKLVFMSFSSFDCFPQLLLVDKRQSYSFFVPAVFVPFLDLVRFYIRPTPLTFSTTYTGKSYRLAAIAKARSTVTGLWRINYFFRQPTPSVPIWQKGWTGGGGYHHAF